GQLRPAGGSAQGASAVSRLGSVPRGTTFPSRVATPAEGPAAAELVAAAWYTGRRVASGLGPGTVPGCGRDRRLSAGLYPGPEAGVRAGVGRARGTGWTDPQLLPRMGQGQAVGRCAGCYPAPRSAAWSYSGRPSACRFALAVG